MNVLIVIELQACLGWGVTVVTCLCDTLRSTLSATKKKSLCWQFCVLYHNKKTESQPGMVRHNHDHSMWEVEGEVPGTQKVILNYTVT